MHNETARHHNSRNNHFKKSILVSFMSVEHPYGCHDNKIDYLRLKKIYEYFCDNYINKNITIKMCNDMIER